MPTKYRVVGTDRHGQSVAVEKPNKASAVRAAEDGNRDAAKRDAPQNWRAEVAEFEWKPVQP
ncbi:hypothetical protein OG225_42500 (plasmid) [Nocardia sp. NBC_01377]|uniref:hypothetical protein n=1 Tax=Nocardia sp. NBC_01377 TaxID=2903595 RepID=UPI002F9163EB